MTFRQPPRRNVVEAAARGIATGMLTPFRFSLTTGHLRSSVARRPMDAGGSPLPWYTYPAIELLSTHDWRDARVVEFGAGNSTLWWASLGARVSAAESDAAWARRIRRGARKDSQIEIIEAPIERWHELAIQPGADVVVVDGGDRARCAHRAGELVGPGGVIVLDNADVYAADPMPDGRPIWAGLREDGFLRVDLHGFAPGNWRPHCTSVFARPDAPLFRSTPSSRGDRI